MFTMKFVHLYQLGAIAAVAVLGAACATAPIPYKTPVSVTPPSGRIGVTQSVTIFDASGSQAEQFADGKATLESVIASMPDGRYEAGSLHFGGYDREVTGLSAFSRTKLASFAKNATFLEGTTPLYDVLGSEVGSQLASGSGRAAVVLISDGIATDYAGRSGVDDRTLVSARQVVANRSGEVCFHTIQSGNSPDGANLLRAIASSTPCGSFRNASSLDSASALQKFSRDVYISGEVAPPQRKTPVAAAIPDTDGDGVVDPKDVCPGTLKQARVDARGCWTLRALRFAVNGAGIEPGFEENLAEDLAVLRANPDVRIRVDGHTDSDGASAYNQSLSERRAAAVRDFLVSRGLARNRFEVKGFGESQPIVANDTQENKRSNRRVEFTIID